MSGELERIDFREVLAAMLAAAYGAPKDETKGEDDDEATA
jgi:hypothetical protein